MYNFHQLFDPDKVIVESPLPEVLKAETKAAQTLRLVAGLSGLYLSTKL